MSLSPLLAQILQTVERPYALAPLPNPPLNQTFSAQNKLAYCLEQVRLALQAGQTPSAALKQVFITALAQLIRTALAPERGDYGYLAQILKHHSLSVQAYVEKLATAKHDQRIVQRHINAFAHPAKLQTDKTLSSLAQRKFWYAAATAEHWAVLDLSIKKWLIHPSSHNNECLRHALQNLIELPELQRLCAVEQLTSTQDVQQYLRYRQQDGPTTGSPEAIAQGKQAQARGAIVEQQAQAILTELAQQLSQTEQDDYLAISAVHFPAHLIAGSQHAKTEWDVLLLKTAPIIGNQTVWDVCLVVEAKANPDAASTDLRRLLRGLALLNDLPPHSAVNFACDQGTITLSSNSLLDLSSAQRCLQQKILYCCPASDTEPLHRPSSALHAASRTQLLNASAALNYAYAVQQGLEPEPQTLIPVWEELLHSSSWNAVLQQYAHQQQAGELLVTTRDLAAACQQVIAISAL